MGLFTNRKHEDAHSDVVSSALAIEALRPSFDVNEASAFDGAVLDWADSDESTFNDAAFDDAAFDGDTPSPNSVHDELAADAVPDVAPPFADEDAEAAFTDFDSTFQEVEPAVPSAPKRVLGDRTETTTQASNVEIDVDGLLELLGVGPDASLNDISQARLRFHTEHDPSRETNKDAAKIKERICREVNTAYASFRLSHSV